ncbi:oxytetracycline resistance efflux MFS transporter OtrB [Streptomyces corynorhini]|uniref:Oxytetracycline resistance efflux MFS transporter OtrB n=1 Tax=Streptomyces corynorhini TaxID=2282652 RepID=A0A370B4B1_9ACTN|nr:oxytetracycline resistance efflux MFS transporter OtrB [Streptomyces corynorhini]RDG35502.1 oxytetracycline resistance efflux MFS transporter OtrB [Streptomyces corynorhini]
MSSADPGPAATAEQAGGAFTHRQILTAMSGLLLAVFLAALDQTVVATAMRTIADDLQGQTEQAWATTAYLIASVLAMPFYGKLSDMYGRKPLYLIAIVVFLGGSVLCGTAGSMGELALFRAVQGLGGGGLMSLPTAVVADLAPVRERGRYFAFLQMAWVVASVVGPLAGGFFAGAGEVLGIDGWRWVFLLNVPLGLLALVTVRKALNLPHERREHRMDVLGAAALTLCLVPLLILAERGRVWGWGSPAALGLLALGVAGLAVFIPVELRRGDEAVLPLGLFRRGGIALTSAVNFTIGVGIFGTVTTLPLFLQMVQGRSPTQAGLVVIPFMLGTIASQVVSGKLIASSGRFKKLAVVGLGSMAGAMLTMATADAPTPMWVIVLIVLWLGVGIGLSQTVITLAMQNAAPKSQLGVANGASGLCRQIGGSTGIVVLFSVMFAVALGRLADLVRTSRFESVLTDPAITGDPANHRFLKMVESGHGAGIDLDDTSLLNGVDPRLLQPVTESFAHGFHVMFLVGGAVLLVGFVMTWFLRELHEEAVPEDEPEDEKEQEAQAERAEEERAAEERADGRQAGAESGAGAKSGPLPASDA